MASVTSLMNSSSTSSLYGNRNVISGLASGMDTESMIENSISGYKSKITSLQQKMTKMQWKQDAYRSLIAQMNNITSKYTSYTSSTNLFSSSFFTKAVNTIANGANAAAVSATGKSSSNVAINRIKQLAEAASYTVGTSSLVSEGSATSEIKWDDKVETSNVEGSISIKYGGGKTGKGSTFTLRFDESEVFTDDKDAAGNVTKSGAQKLADAINAKLKEKNVTTSGGAQSADNYIKAEVKDGKVVLTDQKDNYFAITSVSGGMSNLFEKGEAETISGSTNRGFTSKEIKEDTLVNNNQTTAEYLKGKNLNVTLDGKTKTIKLDDILKDIEGKDNKSEAFAAALEKKLGEEFGAGKITVSADADGALKIQGPSGNGSTLKIAGDNDVVNEALGLGKGGFSNTLQTSWSLKKVLGDDNAIWRNAKGEDGEDIKVADISINGKNFTFKSTDTVKDLMDKINADADAGVEIKYSSMTGNFAITAKETGAASRVDIGGDLGKALFSVPEDRSKTTSFADAYGLNWLPEGRTDEFSIRVGSWNISPIYISRADTIDDIVNKINNIGDFNTNVGVASYNSYTGQIEVIDKKGEKIDNFAILDEWGDAAEFDEAYSSGVTYTAGQDAIFNVNINGENMDLTRSSNTVDLDGMSVTLKNTFGYKEDGTIDNSAEKITFTTSSDSDKIVDAVKAFVEDYNKLVTDLHNAYRTEALKNSSGNSYEPLTDDDLSSMSESAIKAYEDKAKTGILFGDQDLSTLYSKLTESVQGFGELGATLRSIGLEVSFSNGLSTLTLDEDALRTALDNDPDKVKNAFTQTKANGASQDGLMAGLKSTLEMYGSTSIANPGILVNKSGSELSSYSLSHNQMQEQLDAMQEEIEKWQDKMSDRVDYYTNKFTQLEMLINQMNSQSSMLSGMMGG